MREIDQIKLAEMVSYVCSVTFFPASLHYLLSTNCRSSYVLKGRQ